MGGRTRSVVGGVAAALGVAAAMAVGAGASPQSIGFDDLSDGTTVTTQYAARGIEFGPRPGGGTYDKPVVDGDAAHATSDPNLGRLDLGACFPLTSTSYNEVGGRFATAQSAFSLRVMSLSGVAVPFTLQLFDAGGSIVGQDTETAPADGSAGTLGTTVAGGGVVFFRITGGCDNGKKGGIDDLAFDGTDPPPPPPTTTTTTTTTPPPPGRPAPAATIVTHGAVRAGVQTSLDGSTSSGDGLRYRWTFPGARRRGARARAAVATVGETTPFAIHTFPKPGPHDVTLEVTDETGRTTSTTQTIDVTPAAQASLRGPSGPVKPGKKLSLTIPTELQGAGLSFVAWDFHDGKRVGADTLTGGIKVPGVQATRKPAAGHAYRKAGAHQVTAQVVDTGGGTTGLAATVHVGSQAQQLGAGPPPGETTLGVPKGIGASFSFTDTPATKIPVTFSNQTPGKTFPVFKFDSTGHAVKIGEAPVDNVGWKFCASCPEIKEQAQNQVIEHTFEEAGDHQVTLRLYSISGAFIDETTTKIHVRESKCDELKVRGITSTGSCRTPIVIGEQVTGWRTQPYAPERLGGMRLFSSGGIDLYEDSGAVVAQPGSQPFVASIADQVLAQTTGFTVPAPTPNANSGEPGQAAQLVDFVHPPLVNGGTPRIKGLNIAGGDVRLFPGSPARATILLALKPPFDGTVPLIVGGAAAADDAADFSIAAPDIALGPIFVRNLSFAHYGPGHADAHNHEAGWYGGADVDMGFLNIQAADKPTTAPPTGLALADDTGGLKYLGATLDLSSNPIVLGGYAQLQKIGLYVAPGTAPGQAFVVGGSAGIGIPAGTPIVNVDGCAAFALFEAGESGTVCDVHYANLPYDDTIVRVSGTVGIVPLGQVGSGFVQYQSFGQELSFAGKLDDYDVLGLGLFVVSANATGKMNFEPSFSFQTSSHGTLSIGDTVDLGGEFVLSSRGMAGCLDLLTGHVGASYPYGGGISLFGDFDDGCDLTTVGGVTLRRRALPRATDLIAGRGAQAGLGGLPARTVTVKGSPPFVMLGATGQSGSPRVTVTGPKGERIDDDGSPMQKRGGTAIIHSTKLGRTWVYVERPSAGSWSIEPQTGSTPLTAVSLRNGLPEPRVLAKVRRSGRRYTLAYHVTRLPGQEVTFAEGSRVLGRARSADGTLRFAAGPGPGGKRRIVAHVVQGGTPRADMTVASYTAPPPPRVAKPRPKARVRGTTLTLAWGRTANAARYRVRFEASDGRVQTFETSARRRSVVVRRFLRTTSARVTVTAVGADGRTGSPGTVRVRRRGRAPAIVL